MKVAQKNTLGKQVGVVGDFSSLIETQFSGACNALCWQRDLKGDFAEIVEKLSLEEDITEISMEDLRGLELSEAGVQARSIIVSDFENLLACGAQPSLNLLKCYEKDDSLSFIATDVYSFHVDRSPVATDTFLCTYFGASSDIIPNDEVRLKVENPETRSALLGLYDGPLEGFDDFILENYFDLHYEMLPGAKPINLGHGNLWKLAVDHPAQQVLPCVHRAPIENQNELRLLLIC